MPDISPTGDRRPPCPKCGAEWFFTQTAIGSGWHRAHKPGCRELEPKQTNEEKK